MSQPSFTTRPNITLAQKLRSHSVELFTRTMESCNDEIQQLTLALKLQEGNPEAYVYNIRPKFFTGDPLSLSTGAYLLVVSLNYKYEPNQEEYVELNRDADSHYTHYTVSATHFAETRRTHQFFFRFSPLLAGFLDMAVLPDRATQQKLLRHHSFFMEGIPFFSRETRTIRAIRLATPTLRQNQDALASVLAKVPPAAIVLNGSVAFEVLRYVPYLQCTPCFVRHTLTVTTRARGGAQRTAWYEQGEVVVGLGVPHIPVFRCNFIGSISGPNSVEQRLEFGSRIRLACSNEPKAPRDDVEQAAATDGGHGWKFSWKFSVVR